HKLPQDRPRQGGHPTITDEDSIASLRESAEQFRLFVEQAPVGIAMFDRDMRYLAASERWLSIFGLSEESLVGRSHYEVVPDLPKSWKEAHRRALSGETVREEQDAFPRADGRLQWRRWEMQPWRGANGTIGGILIFSEDVTAPRRDGAGAAGKPEGLGPCAGRGPHRQLAARCEPQQAYLVDRDPPHVRGSSGDASDL